MHRKEQRRANEEGAARNTRVSGDGDKRWRDKERTDGK